MKQKNTDVIGVYARAADVIGADKAAMSEECCAVAVRDFTNVAREYFDVKTPLSLQIDSKDGEYAVTLSFKADRVKAFYLLK